jgi:hypothetical protein
MIVKIKTYKRPVFDRLLKYMLHDEGRLFDNKKHSFLIKHNLKGNSISQWVKQFKENETFRKLRRKGNVIFTHEIISFHKDDAGNISLDKLEDIARQYIQKRNINGMFVAVPHFDKSHYHIHICASGVEYRSGKSMRMSKGDFQKLKKDIQQYQLEQFPELSKSVVKHDSKTAGIKKVKTSEKEYQYKLRTGRATEKEQVIGMLKTCYKAAYSKEEFFKLISENGLKTYIRGGKITGVIFHNQKFRINRLGFTEERLEDLNRSFNRKDDLNISREKREAEKEKRRNLSRDL